MTAQNTPDRVGTYPVSREIARGAMGIVYEGLDPNLRRPIAIKVLPSGALHDPSKLEQIRKEAQILASINHPNIATVYSLEQDGDASFFTMELVEGATLGERLREARIPVSKTLELGLQIARALDAAHASSIVHRDLKPANIKITPHGRVKVLDFGLAQILQGIETEADHPLGSSGTPGYMSPGQISGHSGDQRDDLWALGCVLYECLSGQRAFPGQSIEEQVESTLHREPDWAALPGETPPRLSSLLLRCLAKDPDSRISSAREVRRTLSEGVAERLVSRLRSPAATDPTENHNLPEPLSSFVGRKDELDRVRNAVGTHRLVTVTGAGGCGKSRLAVEAARSLLGSYADGIWIAELASMRDPQLVAESLARVLGLDDQLPGSALSLIVSAFRRKRTLLVLDNCEHLLDTCPTIVEKILAECPHVSVLATSRQLLDVPGELVLKLPALSLPETLESAPGSKDAHSILAATVLGSESGTLFFERARSVQPGFEIREDNAAEIAELCHRLDGIPLAIELAASRVRSIPLSQIVTRLRTGYELLAGRPRSVPHHSTLQALIQWSYDQLDDIQRILFRRLSVFQGGWTLDAAEAVCSGGEIEEWDVLQLQSELADRSLLEIEGSPSDEARGPRFRLLESVRDFSSGLFEESEEAAAVRLRHMNFYYERAEALKFELDSVNYDRTVTWLGDEMPNIRAALEFCVQPPVDLEAAQRLSVAVSRLSVFGSHQEETRALLEQVEALPGARQRTLLRSSVLSFLGICCYNMHELEKSRQYSLEALELKKELNADPVGLANLSSNIAGTYFTNQPEKAIPYLEDAIRFVRMADHPKAEARSLTALSRGLLLVGRLDEAISRAEEGLELAQRVQDPITIHKTLTSLADACIHAEDFERARTLADKAAQQCRAAGFDAGLGQALHAAASAEAGLGNRDSAMELCKQSLAVSEKRADRAGMAGAYSNLADLHLDEDNIAEAAAGFAKSLEFESPGYDDGLAETMVRIGRLALRLGRPKLAAHLMGAGTRHLEATGTRLSPYSARAIARSIDLVRKALVERAEGEFARGAELTRDEARERAMDFLRTVGKGEPTDQDSRS